MVPAPPELPKPLAKQEPYTGAVISVDELFDEQTDVTKHVFVAGRSKPFLVGAIPPRMIDLINAVQEQPRPGTGKLTGDQVLWESRIVAAGLRDAGGQRVNRTIEDVIAMAEKIADNMLPGYVKELVRAIVTINRFGAAGSYEALKNGSGSTSTDSTSAPSPSSTSTSGPSRLDGSSATSGN